MAKHFKKNKHHYKIYIFLILAIFILYFLHKNFDIFTFATNELNVVEKDIFEEPIENMNENIKSYKLVEGSDSLEVTGLEIQCSNSFSTVTTRIKNLSSKPQTDISIEIIILDKNGNTLVTLENSSFSIGANEEYETNGIVKLDILDGYDYIVKLI